MRRLDTLGQRRGLSRSRLFEELLAGGERIAARGALQRELEAYYAAPEAEDAPAFARALAGAARLNAEEGSAPAGTKPSGRGRARGARR